MIASVAGVREISKKYGLSAKKKLGQHFLIDSHVLSKIIAAADLKENDNVLEIGPGIGGMTQALLATGATVTAVELDKQLVPILRELFAGEKFTVRQDDILRVDLSEIIQSPVKVVANLPYYITTPVIFRLLESGLPIETITVMIQKEVAARMNAIPSTKDYGSLSLAVQYYADVRLVANVPVNCFMPRPAVDSAVVQLSLLPKPRVEVDKEKLFKVVHAAFGKRRKTLLNALACEEMSKTFLIEKMEEAGINPLARGETLNLFQFAQLAEKL